MEPAKAGQEPLVPGESAVPGVQVDGVVAASKPKRVGVKEVASLAGVSWKTVSNVVNDRPHVRPAMREKVLAAIAELGYRPNLAGRQLRQGSSMTIVLAIPEITSPYFGKLAEHVITSAESRGYTVLIEAYGEETAREGRVLDGYQNRLIDGIIYSAQNVDPEAVKARTDPTPMVLLGERVLDSGLPHIAINNNRSARELVSHLASRGRTRLAFLGDRPGVGESAAGLRLAGFQDGLLENRLAFDERLVMGVQRYSRDEGEMAALRLLNSGLPFDAVVCGSDILSVGVLRAFRRRGIRVPQDVSIVGWDDIPEAEYGAPSLTSISPDIAALAEASLEQLLALMDGRELENVEMEIGYSLKVRESSF